MSGFVFIVAAMVGIILFVLSAFDSEEKTDTKCTCLRVELAEEPVREFRKVPVERYDRNGNWMVS